MNHTNNTTKIQSENTPGILAKSLTTEEWVAGILIMNPTLIGIMSERVSDADFTDPISKAVFQSVTEIVGDDGRDPIDFADRLAKTMGKRGVDAIALQTLCDRVINKIARAVEVEDAEIWSGYLQDESRGRRELKRIEDAERRIVEVRRRFDNGKVTVAEVGAVMREQAEGLQTDGDDGGQGADGWEFLKPSEIDEPIEVEWLWHNFIPKQTITILSGLPKAGKTTLLRAAIAQMETGGACCGQRVEACRVLYVSEEGKRTWKPRCEQFHIGDHVRLCCVPFTGRPSMGDFRRFLRRVERIIKDQNIGIVVFDTASKLLPIGKENESDDVDSAMGELALLTEAGASVVITHHDRKMGGAPVTRMRGSLSFAASADVILSIEKMKNAGNDDPRRVLYGDGRFDEVESELVIELSGSNFIADGPRSAVKRADATEIISEILITENGDSKSADEVYSQWPENRLLVRPKKSKLYELLKQGAESDPPTWGRIGSGRRGSPYRYVSVPLRDEAWKKRNGIQFLSSTHLIGGRNELSGFLDDSGGVSSTEQNGRITKSGLCETTTNGATTNGSSDPDECPF